MCMGWPAMQRRGLTPLPTAQARDGTQMGNKLIFVHHLVVMATCVGGRPRFTARGTGVARTEPVSWWQRVPSLALCRGANQMLD